MYMYIVLEKPDSCHHFYFNQLFLAKFKVLSTARDFLCFQLAIQYVQDIVGAGYLCVYPRLHHLHISVYSSLIADLLVLGWDQTLALTAPVSGRLWHCCPCWLLAEWINIPAVPVPTSSLARTPGLLPHIITEQ